MKKPNTRNKKHLPKAMKLKFSKASTKPIIKYNKANKNSTISIIMNTIQIETSMLCIIIKF